MSNLLPPEDKKKLFHLYRLHVWSVALLMSILVLSAAIIFLLPSLLVFEARIRDVRAQIENIRSEKEVTEAKTLEKEVEETRALLALSNSTLSTATSDVLKLFLDSKQAGITYTQFSIPGPSRTEVRGTARDRQSLVELVRALENNPKVLRVDSPLSNLIIERNIAFVISVEWKPLTAKTP